MTLEQEGCYIRLLAYCWREGSLSNDDEKLSLLCKGGSTINVSLVKKYFVPMPENSLELVHPRLEIEREKQRLWKEKSSLGGRKSAKQRVNSKSKSTIVQPNHKNGTNGGDTLLLQS